MTTSQYPSSLAFFQETTQGTPPADAAAWLASGRRIRHIAESVDPSGLQRQVVEDMRSQTSIFGLNRKVKGLRGVQQPAKIYATGSGTSTSGGSQIQLTDLMRVLQHAFGGLHRSNSTVLAGGSHTTQTINVSSTTNIIVGCLIAVSDTSAGGLPVVRQVTGIDTLELTLDRELPFTPADGDVVSAMATVYIDEAVLADSNGGGGPYTHSVHIQKGLAAALENWQLHGCKWQINSIDLPRGGLPTFDATIFAASFLGPNDAPSPAWTVAATGNAPVAIGPDTEVHLGDFGDPAVANIHVSSCNVSFGVPVIVVETVTEVQDNMEGTAGYATGPADTTVALGIVPMASSWWDDFDDNASKVFHWTKRAAAGGIFSILVPNCEIAAQPSRGAVGAVSQANLELRAFPNLLDTTAIASSKILIGIG
jgi:hypothetical protein